MATSPRRLLCSAHFRHATGQRPRAERWRCISASLCDSRQFPGRVRELHAFLAARSEAPRRPPNHTSPPEGTDVSVTDGKRGLGVWGWEGFSGVCPHARQRQPLPLPTLTCAVTQPPQLRANASKLRDTVANREPRRPRAPQTEGRAMEGAGAAGTQPWVAAFGACCLSVFKINCLCVKSLCSEGNIGEALLV